MDRWSKTEFVKSTHDLEAKGWILDVLLCVERIKKEEFTLDEVYGFEPDPELFENIKNTFSSFSFVRLLNLTTLNNFALCFSIISG